jgi:predicted DsbA family dithiol-disulfide isomerase
MNKPTIKIGVVSDVVCPWCYIGKRRLEKALMKVSDKFNFEIEYFPFELNPQMPAEGMDQKQYLSKKFGGDDRYNEITNHTTSIAAEEGLTFDFTSQKVSPNTRNAHRIIQLAKEYGKQLEMVEALFKAYFTDGVDLSNPKNLIELAVSVGMEESKKIEQFLMSDTGIIEIEMSEREIQKAGITGVPYYVINNKYGISGAQRSESFIKAFEEINSTMSAIEGDSCDTDKKVC